jgi:hypothetical protein
MRGAAAARYSGTVDRGETFRDSGAASGGGAAIGRR